MTISSALPVMADIVVPPPASPPYTAPSFMTVGTLPFVTLAVMANIVLWLARKAHPLKFSAVVAAEKS